jgi:hypothetical protein
MYMFIARHLYVPAFDLAPRLRMNALAWGMGHREVISNCEMRIAK